MTAFDNVYGVNSWADLVFNVFSYSVPPYFVFSVMLVAFGAGCFGIGVLSENVLMALVYGELMFVSLVFGFVVASKFFGDPAGQAYALFILNAVAVESAIGLVLVLNLFRACGSIEYSKLKRLRG